MDTVSKILDAGLDYFLEYRDYFGYSYLHNIAYFGRHELAPYFIEAGFDPKEKDPMEGKTPFQIAKMMNSRKNSNRFILDGTCYFSPINWSTIGQSYFVLRYCIVVCLCKICVDISVKLSFFYPATHKFISNIKISIKSEFVNQLKHKNIKLR